MLTIKKKEERDVLITWLKNKSKNETRYGGETINTPIEQSLFNKLEHMNTDVTFNNDEFGIIRSSMIEAIRLKKGKEIFLIPQEQSLYEKINSIEPVPEGIDWATALKNQVNSKKPISARIPNKADLSTIIQYSVAALAVVLLFYLLLK